MRSTSTTVEITKKVKAQKFTFELEKHSYGLHIISGKHFTSPNSDGIKIRELMKILTEGHRMTVTITISDEELNA